MSLKTQFLANAKSTKIKSVTIKPASDSWKIGYLLGSGKLSSDSFYYVEVVFSGFLGFTQKFNSEVAQFSECEDLKIKIQKMYN